MSYHRGGKVWVDGKGCGWVALEKDWCGDLLPEDLVSENGLVGVDFQLVDWRVRASLGGYAKTKDNWFFFLSDQSLTFHQINGSSLFLVGDFNNWERSLKYQLSKTEGGWGIFLSFKTLKAFEECEFKFLAENDRWIDPHLHFPAFPRSSDTVRNNWFHQKRTGTDLFSFRVIRTLGKKGLEKWSNSRPSGEFGFSFDGKFSNFRIFAPRAQLVEALIYSTPSEKDFQKFQMILSDDGSWSLSHAGNLSGKYYKFRVTQIDQEGETFFKEILDPYALATVGRDGPGIALSRKIFFEKEKFVPPAIEDVVMVEAHLRDLLCHAPFNASGSERLEFLGLAKWLDSGDCYLSKLGANVVELQPVHEFDSRQKGEYHWGYMPVNFFSPASVYGTHCDDGRVLDEFALLVKAFHRAGLAVVLDVVYNHVGIPPHLIHVDKEIYFSTDEDGTLTNFSGCGNDLKCESEPVKKIVIDSLRYWVEVFDVDGFRFDLGELLGFELLSEIQVELQKVKPGILLFAEPWSFRGRLPQKMIQTNYALWSDQCREELLRYAKQDAGADSVLQLLGIGPKETNLHPCQSVNYLESHDDYSLVDRFRDLQVWQSDTGVPDEVVWRIMVAMGILLVLPGVPMISAGQDFLRHKKGIRNTYLLGNVNALDYRLEEDFLMETSFVRKLIKLRLSGPGRRSRQSGSEEWETYLFSAETREGIVFGWKSKKTNEKFLITANNSMSQFKVELPECWKRNPDLLAGYRTNKSNLEVVNPLSFSWFSIL